MRETVYHKLGIKIPLEEISLIVKPLNYTPDEKNITADVYYFRKGEFHARITPQKSRVEISLCKDVATCGRYKMITSGADISKELKHIKKALEDRLI